MIDHHPIYDWQTLALNAVSLTWGAMYSHWLVPLAPSADRLLEWMVALMVGSSVITLNVLKIRQVLEDLKEKRRKKKNPK